MDMTWQGLAYLMEFLVIIIALFSVREMIAEKVYGIRYKRYQEIDTGRHGYVITDKSLNSCTINGMKKAINRANIKNNVLYFVSDTAENLKVEDAKEKYQFYMNSEEFDTVYKNKLLSTLMLSLQNNYLMVILMLVVLCVFIGIYTAYSMQEMRTQIEFVAWKVNQTYAGQ